MTAIDLIKALQAMINEHGDLRVADDFDREIGRIQFTTYLDDYCSDPFFILKPKALAEAD